MTTSRARSTAVFTFLVVAACSGSSAVVGPGPAAGSEGGACPPPGTSCDTGLVCLSNLCVRRADTVAEAGSATDGAGGDGATGGNDGSASGDAASDTGVDAPFDAAACNSKHPIVDAGARYCAAGACYCTAKDACYPTAVAAPCCAGAMTCY